jgi:hypothetical protein
MPNCDFYAAGSDFRLILDFVFAQPGWTLVETASRNDQPLRYFTSSEEVYRSYDIDRSGAHLFLYSPEMGGRIIERPIQFRPGAVPGATGRTDSGGWGLIQLYLSAERDGHVGLSHTNHNSEARATAWARTYTGAGPVTAWNWNAVERISRRLNHHIRRSAENRSGSRVILPEAAKRVAAGAVLEANLT